MSRPMPRPHQAAAVEALQAALIGSDRVQVIMCCGSGKTLVGRWLAERRAARSTLVLVPSLALIAQTLSEWRAAPGWPFEALIICSDPSTADGVRERAGTDGVDIDEPFWARHRAQVTTSPGVAAHRLAEVGPGRRLVVFSTYHSAPVAAAAARASGVTFDLLIADEAHHLAGQPRPEFRVVLAAAQLPAAARVFMTATQVITPTSAAARAALSMHDESMFGPVAYRLDFATAIASGLLADYEVVVYETPGQSAPDPAAALAAAADRGLTRVLSFHGRVSKARAFVAAIHGRTLADGRRVVAQVVTGADPAMHRARALALLENPDPQTLVVLASARCLAEGVDVPAVDGVLFADPKNSDVDLVQAVGRVLRPAPGKTHGQVLIPVCCPPGLDEDTTLSTGPFAAAWRILRGLRGMDPRLGAELQATLRQPSRRGAEDGSRPRVVWQFASLPQSSGLIARLVEATTPAWDGFFAELELFTVEHGRAWPPVGHRLYAWCERQRVAYRRGMLMPERAAALRTLPGWVWDLAEQRWTDQWAEVVRVAGPAGLDLADPQLANQPIPHRRPQQSVTTIGRWCAAQRVARRRGDLPEARCHQLEQIPGWTWSMLDEIGTACADLLGEYASWKRDANPPVGWVDDDLPVGQWLAGIRRLRAGGQLTQPVLDEITVLTAPGTGAGRLRWRVAETLWELGLEAVVQFQASHGHARVPAGHLEVLPGSITVALGTWCTHQRFDYRHGRMTEARSARLDGVPGWRWEIQPTPRISITLGDSRHGTRSGYVKGCRCQPCTTANREHAAARAARAAAGQPPSDWVPATRARGHLRILEGRGATRKGLARAAGLNVKTVVELLDGARVRVLPETEQTILALTMVGVRAAASSGTLVGAAPTWQLIAELTDLGWPKSWIARELGLGRALQLNPDQITAGNAAKVAALHARIQGRGAPARRWREALPPLDQLAPPLARPA